MSAAVEQAGAGLARKQFLTLDGLRGLAAVAVMLFHIPESGLIARFDQTYLAVDFFFVLSGFVLVHAYDELLRRDMGAFEFVLRRYIRLWPLYLVATVIGIAVAFMSHASRLAIVASLAFNLLFLPILVPRLSVDHARVFPLVGPTWSLFFELVANLIYGLIGPRLTGRVLALVLVIGAALCVATKYAYGDLTGGALIANLQFGLGRVVWSFFAGVAVYRLWRRFPAFEAPAWLFALALVGMFAIPAELILVFVGFPGLVYLAASANPTGFSKTFCTRLGGASYGIYVLHKPVIEGARLYVDLSEPLAALALCALVILAALILDQVFDRQARRWLERRLLPGRRRARQALAASVRE